jgi:hypothetical protein
VIDLNGIGVLISGVAAVTAAATGLANRRKIKEVHVLVNSRLDQALNRIGDLQDQFLDATGKEAKNGRDIKS